MLALSPPRRLGYAPPSHALPGKAPAVDGHASAGDSSIADADADDGEALLTPESNLPSRRGRRCALD